MVHAQPIPPSPSRETPFALHPLAAAIRAAAPADFATAAGSRPDADRRSEAAVEAWSVADVLIAGSGADSFGLDVGGTLDLIADRGPVTAAGSERRAPLCPDFESGFSTGDLLIAAEAAAWSSAAAADDKVGAQVAASLAHLLGEQDIRLL